VQIGTLAAAILPGVDLAGTGTTDTGAVNSGQSGEGSTGFEALLAALVAGNTNGQTKLNIDNLELDGVTPETQDIVDALAGMAQALVPLATAFDELQIPTAAQLDEARAALGKLVETINAHPNRPELSINGPIGTFAAQLTELRKAGLDSKTEGASDFAKVGNLLERLDKILNQVAGSAPTPGQQINSDKAALNIQQMVDRLNQLAEKLPTLSAQFEAKLKSQAHVGNSVFEAQTGQTATKQQPGGNLLQFEQSRTVGVTASNGVNIAADPQTQFELDPNKPVARTNTAPQSPNAAATAPTASPEPANQDILAKLANLGQQQQNGETKKADRPLATTTGFADVAADAEAELPSTKMNFAQVTREANLQTANAYPEMRKSIMTASATAPLPSELDGVETGTEKLLGQHRIETFQQQVNHIEAAKSQTGGRQINIPNVAFEIMRQVRAGMQRFEVRLDPPEMGRIDVRMEVDGNNVTARMVVERAETLDLLQRDARVLERALQQAGLNADRANLQFSLKQDGQGAGQSFEQQGRGNETAGSTDLNSTLDEQARLSETTVYRGTTGPGGLNLWV